MKFLSVFIRNFMRIESAEVNLKERGLVCIQGVNEDDPSAKSNGAGKSTLLDAIFWVLYGETARGISGDKVVSNQSKKDCEVQIYLTDDAGLGWSIRRTRKHSTAGNALFLFVESSVGSGVYNDVTKGTMDETQAAIVRLMGCSANVFKAAVYAGQEEMPDLPALTDKFLKLLIEEASGFEELNQAYSNAKKKLSDKEKERGSLLAALERSKIELTGCEKSIATTEANLKRWADDHITVLVRLQAVVSSYEIAAKERREKRDAMQPERLKEALEAIDKKIAEHAAIRSDKAAAHDVVLDSQRTLTKRETEVKFFTQAIKKLQVELDDAKQLVGTPCKSCGKEYHECDIDGAKTNLTQQIAEEQKCLAAVEHARVQAAVALQEAQEASKLLDEKYETLSKLENARVAITAQIRAVTDIDAEIKKADKSVEQARECVNKHMASVNPHVSQLGGLQSEKATIHKTIDELDHAVGVVEADMKTLAEVANLFGPSGLRAHMLDTITPFLNEKTEEYLSALSDGSIHAVWTTLVKNAKGELKEKFTIEVTNEHGGDEFAAQSGGEKRKVRLACWWALQDLVATRAEKPIDLFMGDEIDYALDDAGLERLMGCLEKKAKERGTVLVVSHQSLRDWIDNVIEVRKKGGISVVKDFV